MSLTAVIIQIHIIESEISPKYLVIIQVLSWITVACFPFVLYGIWTHKHPFSKTFRVISTFMHSCGFLYSVNLLIYQPVFIPALRAVYSHGLASQGSTTALLAHIFIASFIVGHSCLGLQYCIFHCYSMSLNNCNSWLSNKKKILILNSYGCFMMTTVSLSLWITLLNAAEEPSKTLIENEYINAYIKAKPSFTIFNFNTSYFYGFIFYTCFATISSTAIVVFLIFDYHKYRKQQSSQLSPLTTKKIRMLTINYRLKVIFAMLFRVYPASLIIYFCYQNIALEGSYICIIMLSAYPVIDILIDSFFVENYRTKVVNFLTCNRKHSGNFLSVVPRNQTLV